MQNTTIKPFIQKYMGYTNEIISSIAKLSQFQNQFHLLTTFPVISQLFTWNRAYTF